MTKFKLTHNITHKIKSNELSQLDCLNSFDQVYKNNSYEYSENISVEFTKS